MGKEVSGEKRQLIERIDKLELTKPTIDTTLTETGEWFLEMAHLLIDLSRKQVERWSQEKRDS
jgi:hypothetical protein